MEPVRFKKEKLVLDTSLFVNPDVRADFGNTPTEAMESFVSLAGQIPFLEFYMPASTLKELLNFIDMDMITGDFLSIIHQKQPGKHELSCPAVLFYELIEDIRERVNKGLRAAEKAVRNAARGDEREIIQTLRRNYREALREGIIDSKEDIDLILLAKELDAILVSADNGVIAWADKFGIKWLLPTKFKEYLLSCLKKHQAQAANV